jgi:group II intron reverse transcriptase/maturase
MSLSPQTILIRHRLKEWSKSGRKQWDLYRYLYDPHVLYDALKLVIKNGGAAGLDGQTIREVRGREWDFVRGLLAQLRAGTYKPGAVRRAYIPKKDGDKRPLGIPDLVDRTIQRALVLLMEPIYETKFNEFSYGFRPGRKAVDCAAVVAKACYELRYVLDADIEKFFDNVDHRKLTGLLKREIVDPRILRLIHQFLKSGFKEPGKPWQRSKKGTPQGGPLSPLLSNIYLHYVLDERFKEVYGGKIWIKLIRYADDFVMLTCRPEERRTIGRFLTAWLREAGLNLKKSKTRWVDMTNNGRSHLSKFDFLGFKFHLRCFEDNRKRFWIARQPSEQSRRELKVAIRERLHVGMTLEEAQQRVEEIWRGWCGYFRYSNANRIFYREERKVRQIINWWLARKFRRQKRAVPWRVLLRWGRRLGESIRPVTVIPNHLDEDQLKWASL